MKSTHFCLRIFHPLKSLEDQGWEVVTRARKLVMSNPVLNGSNRAAPVLHFVDQQSTQIT